MTERQSGRRFVAFVERVGRSIPDPIIIFMVPLCATLAYDVGIGPDTLSFVPLAIVAMLPVYAWLLIGERVIEFAPLAYETVFQTMRLGLLLLLLLAATAAADDRVVDARTGLVIAPGWQDVRAHCGGCHSHALVTQQRADRETWLAMIRWMQATQNLWQFQPETERAILDYLSEHYPARRGQRRQPLAEHLMPP